MRKHRSRIALLLVLALLLSLLGCETVPAATSGTEPSYDGPPISFDFHSEHVENPSYSIQMLPETVENPDNLPVLKWVCATQWSSQIWNEAAVNETNQMLADRNMPFRIQFVLIKLDELYSDNRWIQIPEVQQELEDADLVFGTFGAEERKAYLMPITEYVTGDGQPTLKNAVVHEQDWILGSAGGQIYGIPTYPSSAACNGWSVQKDFMKEHGLTEEDFRRNFWEMDDIFAQIYANNENQPFLMLHGKSGWSSASLSGNIACVNPTSIDPMVCYSHQYIGACFGIDFETDKATVVNNLETDTFRKMRVALMRYQAAGYMSEPIVDEETKEITYMPVSYTVGTANSMYTELTGTTVFIQISSGFAGITSNQNRACGVVAGSGHKEEAITLLNLIAEDEAFREQLCFGKKDRDYGYADGEYTVLKQEDGSRYGMNFLSVHSYFSDVTKGDRYPFSEEGKTKLEFYQEGMDNVDFHCYPIVFDYTGLKQELDAIAEILTNLYVKYTELTEEEYDQMLQMLKDAGGKKIQEELQRQLDEWLANNPDWQ